MIVNEGCNDCMMIVNDDNHFTRQYNPEDSSEHIKIK
jgi:hypothetical protein